FTALAEDVFEEDELLATVAVERFHGDPRTGRRLAFGVIANQDVGMAVTSSPANVVPHWRVICTAVHTWHDGPSHQAGYAAQTA
ncbi:hypothetical protein, partial [Vibrio sp. DNB22_19_1]